MNSMILHKDWCDYLVELMYPTNVWLQTNSPKSQPTYQNQLPLKTSANHHILSPIYILKPSLFFHNSLPVTLTLQPKFKFKSKNKKENNSEEWLIYRFNKNPCWSLTNRNNPWLFQHHQCFIIITPTTTLSNAVHHHHHLLTNHHPRSILLTQAISPIMASPPLHFLSVFVGMLLPAVSLIHAPCRINPCR